MVPESGDVSGTVTDAACGGGIVEFAPLSGFSVAASGSSFTMQFVNRTHGVFVGYMGKGMR